MLGNHSRKDDEGMTKVTQKITFLLQEDPQYKVLPLSPRDIYKRRFWNSIKKFSPDIVHYVAGPTIRSLMVLQVIKRRIGDVLTVSSATKPYFSKISRHLVVLFKPDLVLIQSKKVEQFFQKYGCRTHFLPNGVDTSQFYPLRRNERQALCKKYSIPKEAFLLLHVGSIRKNRNLEVLAKLQLQSKHNLQCLVVGSTFHPIDKGLCSQLEKAGCWVWRQYFENMNEIYNLADCYIFPAQDFKEGLMPPSYNYVGSIDIPLSVMEAMACNLPMITREFGALPRIFGEGDGLFYFDRYDEILEKILAIRDEVQVETRGKVLPYSWDKVVRKLDRIYQKLITDRA